MPTIQSKLKSNIRSKEGFTGLSTTNLIPAIIVAVVILAIAAIVYFVMSRKKPTQYYF